MSYIMCLSFGKVYFVYTATTALLSTSYITIHKKGLVKYTKKKLILALRTPNQLANLDIFFPN